MTDATDNRAANRLRMFWDDGIPILACIARIVVALWLILAGPSVLELGVALLLLWSVSMEAGSHVDA